jgi:hypothetical protein
MSKKLYLRGEPSQFAILLNYNPPLVAFDVVTTKMTVEELVTGALERLKNPFPGSFYSILSISSGIVSDFNF